ncbi:PREDICTED: DNA fragmentation factor subunit alpha-like isoform X2 [Ceratosolen solmsi marchali]|uniref:DNAation factor subunit alpha-like isoform X2 n=1 Tax=Ceratosolen solmsi marchali TaxID=326594 RepID=A0AAJ7E0Y0_9HYME|nr:PREDICTED: DNA fragmentation factor subunit alpha-like isoform X2 [Ceratosolen solmsi marchali]
MSDKRKQASKSNKIYKIIDHTRRYRKSITASSLGELIKIARMLYNIPTKTNITIVLEQDEIDDEEYFATFKTNTNLMILYGNQKWIVTETKTSKCDFFTVDDTDSKKSLNDAQYQYLKIKSLICSLKAEPSRISLLTGADVEKLSDINLDNFVDVISNGIFFEQLKESLSKFLAEKRQVHESIDLLQVLTSNTNVQLM